ncbi:hypothetical protein BH20ACT2_BH20ACT2_14710 [soil metagenome]
MRRHGSDRRSLRRLVVAGLLVAAVAAYRGWALARNERRLGLGLGQS